MKKILFFLVFLIVSSVAHATTWYFESDGGDRTRCTGTVAAADPGAGTAQPCAFKHPWLALGWVQKGVIKDSGVMSPGDTLIDVKPSDVIAVGGAGYKAALGAIPTGCTAGSVDCNNLPPPSGIDAQHPTRILGYGYDNSCPTNTKVEWWANGYVYAALYLGGSLAEAGTAANNVDVECLNIDDHDLCVNGGANPPPPTCTNPAIYGVLARTNNGLTFRYLDVHGISSYPFQINGVSNVTWDHVNALRNGAGINFDQDSGGGGALNDSGTFLFEHSRVAYSGCQETYPGLAAQNCWWKENSFSPPAADGLGWGNTTMGQWTVLDSMIDHNGQDGFDGLHVYNTSDYVHTIRSIFEGNVGNQIKVQLAWTSENDMFIGDCNYFYGKSFSYSALVNTGPWLQSLQSGLCRAGGTTIELGVHSGEVDRITGATIYGVGGSLIASSGSGCDSGTHIYLRNSMLRGGRVWHDDTANYSLGTNETIRYYAADGTDTCASQGIDEDFDQFFGTSNGSGDVSGAHSRYGDPLISGTLSAGPGIYSADDNLYLHFALSASSPLRFAVTGANAADESVVANEVSDLSIDHNSVSRGVNWDGSAYQYLSCKVDGLSCFNTNDCCNLNCGGNGICGSCIANGQSSSSASTCCSGYLNGGLCVPYVCGDGIITQGQEICDTNGPQLNGKTCYQLGFIQGNPGCAAGCQSYDTSGCNNICLATGNSCVATSQCCTPNVCSNGICVFPVGDITTSLVGWWKFDEGTGTAAADSSGNGYSGVLQNTSTWVTGQIGPYGLSFDGATEYVSLGSIGVPTGANSRTVTAWFKTSSTSKQTIFGYGSLVTSQQFTIMVNGAKSIFIWGWGAGKDATITTPSTITDGNWHHLAVVYSSGTEILYIDGASVGTFSVTLNTVINAHGVNIGVSDPGGSDGNSNQYFNGSLDDVRVYSRALSALDISTLYAYTSCTVTGGFCATTNDCCGGNTCTGNICTSSSGGPSMTRFQWTNGIFRGHM